MIFLSMLLLGTLIGFVGAGGVGVTITLLTVGFNIPIHIALGVALFSMVFTMISGVISHLHENEVELKTGLIIGLGGVIGAFVGAKFSTIIPENILSIFTALMIILSALILYIKVYHNDLLNKYLKVPTTSLAGKKFYIYGILVGCINGIFYLVLFGIGAATFIQISLLIIFGVLLLKSIGTCMLIILPISASGGLGYLTSGNLDFTIFLQTVAGLMIGAFISSKFTHLAPKPILKFAIVAMPTIGGLILLLFH